MTWVRMDNTSSNATAAGLSVGGLLAYYIFFIVVVILPVVVINVLILVALLLDRTTTSVVRVILCNIPIACLEVAAGILVFDFAGVVLVFSDELPTNNHGICKAVLFLVGSGGAARLLFLAAFSITVYVIIRFNIANLLKSRKYIFWCFVGAVVVLWIIAILGTFSVTLDVVITTDCRFAEVGALVQLCIFAVVFGACVFLITTVFLILTIFYIRKNTITDRDAHFKKAMLKLSFFLLIGNIVNLIGQILPPLIAIAVITTGISGSLASTVANVSYVLIDLSLVPSPILLIIYFKPVRLRLKSWFCCCCKSRKTLTLQKSATREVKLSSD